MNEELLITRDVSIKQSLRVLDKTAMKVLFVVDNGKKLVGSLTDGDIRRAILRGDQLDASIEGVFNGSPISLRLGEYESEEVKKIFIERKIDLIPVLDSEGRISDMITWDMVFADVRQQRFDGEPIELPVIVMAGGKGSRLAPFTTVLPKPLIPIGDRTILELIMEEFWKYGATVFYLTLNYRGEMIRAYFEGQERNYPIEYLWEKEFLGTAGSLRLARGMIHGTFIVSNCDILVRANYADVLALHRESKASLTIISSIQHHKIPYGVVDFKAGGEVVGIREKPEFSFSINTGVYFLEEHCLDLIPEGEPFHMTQLIELLLAKGEKIYTYPVNENDYVDIGQWDQYRDAVAMLKT